MKKYIIGLLLLLLSAFCLPCYAETISVPMEQWNELKMTLEQQETELKLLESELIMLSMPSDEAKKQLAEAKQNLTESKQELYNAERELNIAKDSIDRLSTSLNQLKEQIEVERAENNKTEHRLRLQRNILLIVGALLAVR